MNTKSIQLRKVLKSDCKNIYEWRNAKAVRAASIQSAEINFAEHESWFERTINRNDILFLIAEFSPVDPLGTLRFDIKGNLAEISIYLTPNYIGKGYGATLLNKAEEWLKTFYPKISIIEAKILAKNLRSLKTFVNAGFSDYLTVLRKEFTNE